MMNGIIVVNKPNQMTSQQVLTKIKHSLGVKKIGHVGTLDPMATGVLVALINDATKLSDYFMGLNKTYLATIAIGQATTTEDATGEVVAEKKVARLENVDAILQSFIGESLQTPPMYSSIRHQGMKLYEIARQGKTVKRQSRMISIFDIKRTNEITYSNEKAYFSFVATVSKGTYIRTLCVDIGEKLGYPAHMASLHRLSVGKFTIAQSNTLDDIIAHQYTLISMLDALSDYPIIQVNPEQQQDIFHGKPLSLNVNDDMVVLAKDNQLLAIYEKEKDIYKARRVWN